MHVVEPEWVEPMRRARVVAYRLPPETFEPWDRFWISREPVEPEELVSRAVEAGVFGYLVKPFREQDLLPAIHAARARHAELQELREEAESLAEALAARKVIERAKGLLMEKERLSEQEAFGRLRKASQVSGRPLKVIAEAVVATLGGDE